MSLRRRRSTGSGTKRARRRGRTQKDEESECFSDEVDIDVARRLHSLHVSSLALYEVYFGYSDDQVKIGSPSVVSSCSEVPGSPTRFPGADYRRKRNALKSFRRGRKKKKMDQQCADWMEVAEAFHTRGTEMPEKGGNPLLKGHRFNPLTRGKQKLPGSSVKKKCTARLQDQQQQQQQQRPVRPSSKSEGQAMIEDVSETDLFGTHSSCSVTTDPGTPRLAQLSPEGIEDMEDESCDSFPSSVPMPQSGRETESELSETADEQGGEADDEESSFEGILSPHNLTYWFDKELPLVSSEEDEAGAFSTDSCLGTILHGLQPIMSTESWRSFTTSVRDSQTTGNKRQNFKSFPSKRYFRRPQSRRPTEPKLVYLSPEEMNTEIVRFVGATQMENLRLPLMSRKNCRMACNLAKVYGIQYSTDGEKNVPVAAVTLHKTGDTHLADQGMVKEKIRSFKQSSPLLGAQEGQEVANGVPAIQESNLGHRMLESLGWAPGQGLGRHENGMVLPVQARVKRSKSGLGF